MISFIIYCAAFSPPTTNITPPPANLFTFAFLVAHSFTLHLVSAGEGEHPSAALQRVRIRRERARRGSGERAGRWQCWGRHEQAVDSDRYRVRRGVHAGRTGHHRGRQDGQVGDAQERAPGAALAHAAREEVARVATDAHFPALPHHGDTPQVARQFASCRPHFPLRTTTRRARQLNANIFDDSCCSH